MIPRIVFMGSPDFAIPTLRALAQHYPVSGVITQPDREAGRGRALTPPPIKSLAQQLNIPVIQPHRLREPEVMEQLKTWKPDVLVVVAFGQILRSEILDFPPHGCINVHASLLPRWRGAAPIQAAILHGDSQTGISIMLMDPGVDTGPVIYQHTEPILPDDNAATLGNRLSMLGAALLLDCLPDYLAGKIAPRPQDSARATYAPMLKKEDGELDFTRTSTALEHKVRALKPWPGAYTTWQGQILKIHRCTPVPSSQLKKPVQPGQHVVFQGLPAVGTADGLLVLEELQPAGKKSMLGKAFLQGARNWT